MDKALEKKLSHYRLSGDEYSKICELLGKAPEGVEWALFSALWSEHCSYKSTRLHLKKFSFRNERVLESFGENAGVIDLGQGERIAFKMESHNHPSFIAPYQGAATGVGGILRDIFTMGARPVALGNYLCFGRPEAERMPQLVDGVVRGIGGYGNCVGVPTITGQTEFDFSYDGNILVNAFALGVLGPGENLVTSKAKGPGNLVVYVGAKTGGDGVHGASMASESFDEESESKRPTIQIGDPFFEKLLIESCLEVIRLNLVVAIQDMGAAGLTSSSFEMASNGNVGLTLHLDRVPLRQEGLGPEEILLSESQERMLLVCEPEKLEQIQKVFKKWNLDAVAIGEVKSERTIELWWKGDRLVDIDPQLLTENAPLYDRAHDKLTPEIMPYQELDLKWSDAKEILLKTLSDERGCSRDWVFDQYDQRVGASTIRDASESVGVIRLKDSDRALGIVLGCRPSLMRKSSRLGALDAVFYPALELAVRGFEPLGVTDCLNFGNPEKKEVMTQIVESIDALSEASRALNAPVISGNASLYNETLSENITPTPSTGVVGLRASTQGIPFSCFKTSGEKIFLLRLPQVIWPGEASSFQKDEAGSLLGDLDTQKTAAFIKEVRELSPFLSSTRVVGKFGLGYALARMSFDGMGASCDLKGLDPFAERLYEVIVSVSADQLNEFEKHSGLNCEVVLLGETQRAELRLKDHFSVNLDELKKVYKTSWRSHFAQLA